MALRYMILLVLSIQSICNRCVESRVYIKLPCLVYAQENLAHKDQRYLNMCISPFLSSSFYLLT